jgi:hypothetical protein
MRAIKIGAWIVSVWIGVQLARDPMMSRVWDGLATIIIWPVAACNDLLFRLGMALGMSGAHVYGQVSLLEMYAAMLTVLITINAVFWCGWGIHRLAIRHPRRQAWPS